MEELVNAETDNAREAISFVQRDSRLGWEPSMEYLGDADHIRWKIQQMEYMLKTELSLFKQAATVKEQKERKE